MNKQLIFIDDSGDPGFTKSSSTNFLMASAVFIDAKVATQVNNTINDYKKSLGWSEETEFKFTSTNKKIIKELLQLVSKYDFKIYSVYINKSEYKNILPIIDGFFFRDFRYSVLICSSSAPNSITLNLSFTNHITVTVNTPVSKAKVIKHKTNV